MTDFEMLSVTDVSLEDGNRIAIKIETKTGPLILRMPVPAAKSLLAQTEFATTEAYKSLVGATGAFGFIEPVERAFCGVPEDEMRPRETVYMFIETEKGPRNYSMTQKVAEGLLSTLIKVVEKSYTRH